VVKNPGITRYAIACLLVVVAAACGGAPAAVAHRPGSPSPRSSPSPQVVWPAPAANPNYPPRDLADLAALAAKGVQRRPVWTESQPLELCAMGWTMIQEFDGTPSEQLAADLMRMAVQKKFLFASCGGNLFGSTDTTYCNCYRGDHGVMYIERGYSRQPAPGMMQVIFWVKDTGDSPGDWRLTVPAPAEPS
jgi:hypothetical protein